MIIYKATNKENGKAYIGQTIFTLEMRKRQHCQNALHGCGYCRVFAGALKKYGAKAFDWTRIDTADNLEDLNILEELWIEAENTLVPEGYNLLSGGSNCVPCQASRKRMSDSSHLAKKVIIDGQEFDSMVKAAKALNIYIGTLRRRMGEFGHVLTKEQLERKQDPSSIPISIDGQRFASIKKAARAMNTTQDIIHYRIREHGTILTTKMIQPAKNPNAVSISINGQNFATISEAAKSLKVTRYFFEKCVKKYGNDLTEEMLKPQQHPNTKKVTADGKRFDSITKAVLFLGIARGTVCYRLNSPSKEFANYSYDQ